MYTIKNTINNNFIQQGTRFNIGEKSYNRGEFIEIKTAEIFGIENHIKDSIAYDMGSDIDINEMHISVKSCGSSLTDKITRKNTPTAKTEIINEYVNKVHSNTFCYSIIKDDMIIAYIMNKDEFEKMLNDLWTVAKCSRKDEYKLRIRKSDNKVIEYFNGLI